MQKPGSDKSTSGTGELLEESIRVHRWLLADALRTNSGRIAFGGRHEARHLSSPGHDQRLGEAASSAGLDVIMPRSGAHWPR